LIIDRKDKIINLCEMKFSINEYVISKDYEQKLIDKISTLSSKVNKNTTIHPTLITMNGFKRNEHSSLIIKHIDSSQLFNKL